MALPEFPGSRWFLQANKAQRGGAERAIAGKNHQDPGVAGRANLISLQEKFYVDR